MDALAFDNDKHRARVNFNNSAILLDDIGNTQFHSSPFVIIGSLV